jgi:hypothetical protein
MFKMALLPSWQRQKNQPCHFAQVSLMASRGASYENVVCQSGVLKNRILM